MDFFVVDDAVTHQRSTALPNEVSMLVTDTLAGSATFVLTHFLARTLRESKRPTVLVSLSHPLTRYTAICRKAGVHLDNALVKARFRFVDGLNILAAPTDGEQDGQALHALHSAIADALSPLLTSSKPKPTGELPPIVVEDRSPVIIVDDLTASIWSGAATVFKLKSFYRSLQVLLKPHRGSLLSLAHADTSFAHASAAPDATELIEYKDDAAIRELIRSSDIWIQARSLGSQTVGELVVHRAPSLGDRLPGLLTNSRSHPTQFKLEDTGAKFFAKGAAKEYL